MSGEMPTCMGKCLHVWGNAESISGGVAKTTYSLKELEFGVSDALAPIFVIKLQF